MKEDEKKELKVEMLERGIVNRTVERMAEEKSRAIEARDTRLKKKERANIFMVAVMLVMAAALTVWAFILARPVELEVHDNMLLAKTENMNNLQTAGECLLIVAGILAILALARVGAVRRHMKQRLAWRARAEQRLQAETELLLAEQRCAHSVPLAAVADPASGMDRWQESTSGN